MTDPADTIRRALEDASELGGDWWDREHSEAALALDVLVARAEAADTLRETLRFYADPVSYEPRRRRHVRPVIADRGQRARDVLARLGAKPE